MTFGAYRLSPLSPAGIAATGPSPGRTKESPQWLG